MDGKEKRAAFTKIGREVDRARKAHKVRVGLRVALSLGLLFLAALAILRYWPGKPLDTLTGAPPSAAVGQETTAAHAATATVGIIATDSSISTATPLVIIIPGPTETAVLPEPVGIQTYTAKPGDFLFSIADEFHLHPESVLWSNWDVLKDHPQMIRPGMVLIIPPVDGLIYPWQTGDRLAEVAERFGVEPEVILAYPGNQMSGVTGDAENISFEVGRLVIIPGGSRPLVVWPTGWPTEGP